MTAYYGERFVEELQGFFRRHKKVEEWLVWAFVVASRGTWMTSLRRSSSTIQESLRRTFCHRPHKHHTAFGNSFSPPTPNPLFHFASTTSDTIDDNASMDSHGATAHADTLPTSLGHTSRWTPLSKQLVANQIIGAYISGRRPTSSNSMPPAAWSYNGNLLYWRKARHSPVGRP